MSMNVEIGRSSKAYPLLSIIKETEKTWITMASDNETSSNVAEALER